MKNAQIIVSKILHSNDLHSLHLFWLIQKGSLLWSVRETEEVRDTFTVIQLISVHLGMQVSKNDIILLTTLNCLKFTKKREKKMKER